MLIFLLFLSQVFAADLPGAYGKWEAECFFASYARTAKVPLKNLSFCSNPKMKMTYRQIPIVLENLFKSERKDVRENSLQLLDKFSCANEVDCFVLKSQLTIQSHKNKLPVELKKKVNALIGKYASVPNELHVNDGGVCSDRSDSRLTWVQKIYDLYCPPEHVATDGGDLLSNKKIKEKFFNDLTLYSGQAVMSSTRLLDIEHIASVKGVSDCESPWKVVLKCDGMKNIEFNLNCEKKSGKVECRPN